MPKIGTKSKKDVAKGTQKKSNKTPVIKWVFFGNTGNLWAQGKFKPLFVRSSKTPSKQQKKKALEVMFDNYFFGLSHKQVSQMMKEWNELNLKIELEDQKNYDEWLNYFKKIPVAHIRILLTTGEDILGAEGYAALTRWVDIISNPGRIDKIHKAGLTGGSGKEKTIISLAEKNDRYGVLKALRAQIAAKLQQNPGNRDTNDLVKQMMAVMTEIAIYEKRHSKKKTTKLDALRADMPTSDLKKRPTKAGSGHRKTSFKSRVTIKDMEANNG